MSLLKRQIFGLGKNYSLPTDMFQYWTLYSSLYESMGTGGNLYIGDGTGSGYTTGRKKLSGEAWSSAGTRLEGGYAFDSSQLTYSTWVKFLTPTVTYSLFSYNRWSGSPHLIIYLNKTGTSTIDIECYNVDGTLKNFTSGFIPNNNEWNNITITIDRNLGSDSTKIFINGIQIPTTKLFSDNLSSFPFGGGNFEHFGKYPNLDYYYGFCQQIRLFKRVITNGEIMGITLE